MREVMIARRGDVDWNGSWRSCFYVLANSFEPENIELENVEPENVEVKSIRSQINLSSTVVGTQIEKKD